MKKLIILLLLQAMVNNIAAQDIRVVKFERNYTSLIASMNPVYDNTGEACALLRFFVRNSDFTIEPNLGIVRRDQLPGEIRLWVPKGTKRLTVRHEGMLPLNGYEVPIAIESKVTYDVELRLVERKDPSSKEHGVYVGAGYNITAVSGPSVAFGVSFHQHNVEIGATFGLNATDDLYFYDSQSNVNAAYNYKAVRIQLRYGYDVSLTDFLSIMPQVGGVYSVFNGKEVVKGGKDYGSANAVALCGAVRLGASLNEHFRLHITPEYDFCVSKDNTCKWIADYDKTFKGWTEGFNLNIGLTYLF